jgi:hypothetical protein
MINLSDKDMDKTAFQNEVKITLVKNQCGNENMVKMLKMGVQYDYMYQDRDGNLLAIINVSKKDCGLTPSSTAAPVNIAPMPNPGPNTQAPAPVSAPTNLQQDNYLQKNYPEKIESSSGESESDKYFKQAVKPIKK